MGGGGYSGGMCEDHTKSEKSHNGANGCGGSYYNSGFINCIGDACYNSESTLKMVCSMIGGQGSVYSGSNWTIFSAGSGGQGGQGGNIEVSSLATIMAYNGDANTTGDHSQLIPAINVSLTTLSGYSKRSSITTQSATSNLENVDIPNKGTITPAYIVAQSGICRETYYVNQEGNTYDSSVQIATYYNAINCLSTEAKNVTCYKQGIGSGAGYLEVSNGSYKIDGVEQMK